MNCQVMDIVDAKTIHDVPEEILEYIITALSAYKDLKHALCVCKQWHRITKGVIRKLKNDFQKAIDTTKLEWMMMPCEVKNTITERYSHSAVYYNKMLYVFGGCTSANTTFNDLWCYDLANRVWIRTLGSGSYPSPKACASMVRYQDKLILFGGWTHPTPYPLHQAARFYNQLHIYDTCTSTWQHMVCQNSPQGKAGHAAAVVRNLMLVFGGSHGHGVSCNELWVLDLHSLIWQKEDLQCKKPMPRYGHSFIVLDDYHLLLMGGCGGPNNQFSDMWLLNTSVSPWQWREVFIGGQENSPQQLWCHGACRVGDKIIVLSKAIKPPVPLPIVEPVPVKPLLTTKLAQARRAMPDTSESSSQDSSSDTDDVAQRNCRTVRLRNAARSPHHRHLTKVSSEQLQDRPGNSSGGSSADFFNVGTSNEVEPVATCSDFGMDVDDVVCLNCRSQRDVCTCEEGFCPSNARTSPSSVVCSSGVSGRDRTLLSYQGMGCNQNSKDDKSTSAQNLAGPSTGERVTPFKVPFKSSYKGGSMPSVRPNASKNRQKQLDTLRMYEEKFRAKMAAAGVDSKDVKVQGHNVEVVKTVKKPLNPMYIHTLDISNLIDKNNVTWQPLVQNCGTVPEETIFYSLDQGRGELIMFGGIQADLGSMQRGLSVDKQVVSKHVYVIRPKSLGIR